LNGKIVIRSAKQEDAEGILEIYTPYILHTPVSFETEVPDIEAFRQRMVQYQKNLPWLVCEVDNNLAGYTYATNHRHRTAYDCSKELSVYVHPNYRHRGIASGLYSVILEILKLQGVRNVLAGIALPNPESVGFHEQFGFKLVGIYHDVGYKFDRYHDVGWWELPIGTNTKPHVPWAEFDNTIKWQKAIQNGISRIK
jgi:phosphinothricin acetyltransferase